LGVKGLVVDVGHAAWEVYMHHHVGHFLAGVRVVVRWAKGGMVAVNINNIELFALIHNFSWYFACGCLDGSVPVSIWDTLVMDLEGTAAISSPSWSLLGMMPFLHTKP